MAESGSIPLHISTTPRALAASLLAEALTRSGPRPRLAIPGGSAAAVLGDLRKSLGQHWSNLCLTWVDERCVAESHVDSNRGAARTAGWLDSADPPGVELPLWRDVDADQSARAADRFTTSWTADFDGGLDVVLLGLGPDGHVASLFPGSPLATDEAGTAPFAVVTDSPKPPPRRVTLTRSALKSAGTTILYATGEAKRDALRRVLAADPALPATGLPGIQIVTDFDPRV